MNKAAMNFHIKVLVWFLVLLGKIPGSEIAVV